MEQGEVDCQYIGMKWRFFDSPAMSDKPAYPKCRSGGASHQKEDNWEPCRRRLRPQYRRVPSWVERFVWFRRKNNVIKKSRRALKNTKISPWPPCFFMTPLGAGSPKPSGFGIFCQPPMNVVHIVFVEAKLFHFIDDFTISGSFTNCRSWKSSCCNKQPFVRTTNHSTSKITNSWCRNRPLIFFALKDDRKA